MLRCTNSSKAIAMAIIIIVSNTTILYFGTLNVVPLLWSIGSIGTITFFGTLILTNILSKTRTLDKSEIRTSITSSVLLVYFVLIGLVVCVDCNIRDSIEIESILNSLTGIVGVLIAFYFGSRAIEGWKQKNRHTDLDEQ